MKLDAKTKVEPIHHLSKTQQGTLYRNSRSHFRNKSVDKQPANTPYIELLAVKSNRGQKHHHRQGAVSFSYRRWFDSPIGVSLKEAITERDFPYQYVQYRPETEQLIRIRKVRHQSPSQEDLNKDGVPHTSRNFRRTLKGLKDKVRERLKHVVPSPLNISEVRPQLSERELLMCNKIIPWKQHLQIGLQSNIANLEPN